MIDTLEPVQRMGETQNPRADTLPDDAHPGTLLLASKGPDVPRVTIFHSNGQWNLKT